MMKKKLIAGLLTFAVMASTAMPALAAPKATGISVKGKRPLSLGARSSWTA